MFREKEGALAYGSGAKLVEASAMNTICGNSGGQGLH